MKESYVCICSEVKLSLSSLLIKLVMSLFPNPKHYCLRFLFFYKTQAVSDTISNSDVLNLPELCSHILTPFEMRISPYGTF